MNLQEALSVTDLEKLSALDTCTVSNAIERLNVRLRNEGFVSGTGGAAFQICLLCSGTLLRDESALRLPP